MFIKTPLVRFLTFGYAAAITLFPFVLVRPETPITRRIVVHEKIHLKQQAELFVLPFFLLYFLEYLVYLAWYRNHPKAYFRISFEREAYTHDRDVFYLVRRKPFSWIHFLS